MVLSTSLLSAFALRNSVLESTLEGMLAFLDDLDADLVSSPESTSVSSSAADSGDEPLQHTQSAGLLSFVDAIMPRNGSFFLDSLQRSQEDSDRADVDTNAETSAASDSVAVAAEVEEPKAVEASSVKSVATRKRNTYRDKMKHELQYLRLRTAELEEKLAALKQGATLVSSEDRAMLDSAWKRIAANQKEYREQSEAENEELKREVSR